jgi:hypothetical protein
MSLRAQLLPEHVHPVPDIVDSVSPPGTFSVTVTVPMLGPAPVWFDTVTVYVPVCPTVKFPLCVLLTLSAGGAADEIPRNISRKLLVGMGYSIEPHRLATARSLLPSPLNSPTANDSARHPTL